MLQVRNRPTLFAVRGDSNLKPRLKAKPTRRDRIVSYIYWTCRNKPGGKGRFFFSDGTLKQRAVAEAMNLHGSSVGRVLAGKSRPEEDFIEGLMLLAGYEEREEMEARLADFRPIPAGKVRNYPIPKKKRKK